MAEAFRANVGGDLHKVEVGGPVANRVRAAEGDDDQGAGMVDGHVAGHAC